MLRSPSAALTRSGKTPPTAPAAMPAPVACKNDRRDHLPCRTRLAPSYVMSVSSEVIGLFLELAQQPRRACWALRVYRHYYSTTAQECGQPLTLQRNAGSPHCTMIVFRVALRKSPRIRKQQ